MHAYIHAYIPISRLRGLRYDVCSLCLKPVTYTNPLLYTYVQTTPLNHAGTVLRTAVFKHGWGEVCKAREGGVLPSQLGLHQMWLTQTRYIVCS